MSFDEALARRTLKGHPEGLFHVMLSAGLRMETAFPYGSLRVTKVKLGVPPNPAVAPSWTLNLAFVVGGYARFDVPGYRYFAAKCMEAGANSIGFDIRQDENDGWKFDLFPRSSLEKRQLLPLLAP